jgi:hypothetical protein
MRNILIAGVSALALSATGAMAQTATIDQDGDNGEAFIDQVDAGSGATASITQGTPNSAGFSDTDTAAIEQSDDGTLDAEILQNADQFLLGRGGDNVAGVVQDNGTGSATAFIEQAGSENRAGIVQAAQDNDASIEQGDFAFDNDALIKQDDGDFTGLAGTPDFEAELNPGGASPSGAARNSFALITQSNSSEFSEAVILQSGDSNDAEIAQQDTEQTASIDQSGDDQTALVLQELEFNTATVLQESEGNETFVDQFGSENLANVAQTGDFNDAVVIQSGDLEQAFVTQAGTDGIAQVDQSGSNNSTNVDQ